jgi:hypothetical protein
VNVEIAASVANFSGPGPDRGWPDVDMISGHWDAEVERMRLSFIAVVGSPLLLSFDVRSSNASTLGLDAYLNPELLAIHGDDASPAVKARGQYYARVSGGAVTGPHSNGSYPAGPVDTGADCSHPNAQWRWHPSNRPPDQNHSWGTLESAAMPGYCLALWDTEPGKFCLLPLLAQLVECGKNHDGCAAQYSQQWGIGGAAHNWSLATALDWSGGPNHMCVRCEQRAACLDICPHITRTCSFVCAGADLACSLRMSGYQVACMCSRKIQMPAASVRSLNAGSPTSPLRPAQPQPPPLRRKNRLPMWPPLLFGPSRRESALGRPASG